MAKLRLSTHAKDKRGGAACLEEQILSEDHVEPDLQHAAVLVVHHHPRHDPARLHDEIVAVRDA